MRIGLILLAAAVMAPAAAAAAGPCRAAALRASFAHVPGSDATGHSLYRLRLSARATTCLLSGPIALRLLGVHGQALPTHVTGRITVRRITPSGAKVNLELSRDLAGPGEPRNGACEPTAVRLRVSLAGGGAVLAAVSPATPVCDHGRMLVIGPT